MIWKLLESNILGLMLLAASSGIVSGQTPINVAGTWDFTNSGSVTCVSAEGSEELPASGSGRITLWQTGFNIGWTTYLNSQPYPRTGTIDGGAIQVSGIFLVALVPEVVFSQNNYTAQGSIGADNCSITLAGSGFADGTAFGEYFSCTGQDTLVLKKNDPPFTDVCTGHWARDFILALYNSGITGGCSTNPMRFCPDAVITRGQMAVFLVTSLRRSPNSCQGRFSDVPIGHPYCGFIERLTDDGITSGCGGNKFCPNDPVTRGQMAVFIEAALGNSANACTGRFGDVPSGHPFCGFVEKLNDDGITGGCGGGNFCPNNPVTRAEMAIFLTAAPDPLTP